MKPNYGICGFPVLLPVTVLKADCEHYATMLRVALGIDAAMTQGKL